VRGVDTSLIVKGVSNQLNEAFTLPAAAGTVFSADCSEAAAPAKMGAAPVVSIYFESVNSVARESAAIISIEYD
jgi:hypothetical protein